MTKPVTGQHILVIMGPETDAKSEKQAEQDKKMMEILYEEKK